MKTKNLLLLPVLIASLGLILAGRVTAQTFTTLHTFTALSGPISEPVTNSDGAVPGRLVLSGNTLYGAALYGGSSGYGTVFAVNTDGTGYTTLHNFTGGRDGSLPFAGLISGNTLYGTASQGGNSGFGMVFKVSTSGTGFTTLHWFTGGDEGSDPGAGLILSGNTLYGTAAGGGSSGSGTVFSLSFRPQLTVIPSGADIILTWPTNVAGFDYTGYTLQTTTNLVSPAVWTAVSPGPVVINGQNAVTNPISGTQQFYRLRQ